MDKQNYNKLFKQYLNNELSEKELMKFLDESEANKDLFLEEIDHLDLTKLSGELKKNEVFEKIVASPDFVETKIKRLWLPKLLKVAAMLLTFGSLSLISYHYFYDGKVNKQSATNSDKKNILLSGKNSVTIQLTNGEKIVIDEANFSQKIEKNGITVSKDKNGSIVFKISDSYVAEKTSGFHTFSTPKGESFVFVLPDESKIWLNSNTKLKIPANFNLHSRDVHLSGEAYFEVAHNAAKPFKIHTSKDLVQVLGTEFNVKAYANNRYNRTTLLHGSVLVSTATQNLKLIPGEQASTDNNSGNLSKKIVDVEQVVGWKEGYFKFANQPIKNILEELTLWYDIKFIDFQVENNERFTASIKRTRSLAEVLRKIEKVSSLKFKIKEGGIEVVE